MIFGERRKPSKTFGVHLASPQLEGKHPERWYNICDVLVDTIITPLYFGKLVILCGDTILCMNAY